MFRFMKNRRNKSSSSKQGTSGEVATPADVISGDGGTKGDEVILTSVRPTDPDGGDAGSEPPASESAGEPQVNGSAGGEVSNGARESPQMSVIPEEPRQDEAAHLEEDIAAEPNYAYPDGEADGEAAEDQESVVTVVEKRPDLGLPEDDKNYTYATVNKQGQGLRARGEQLHDRYTPDHEVLAAAGPGTPEPEQSTPVDEDQQLEEEQQRQRQQREEDYYIYVSEDAIQNGHPKTSPISVELACPTFDSPERQDSIRANGPMQQGPEQSGEEEQGPRRAFLRQNSAPAYPGEMYPEDHEYDPETHYLPGKRHVDPEYAARRQPEHHRGLDPGYKHGPGYEKEMDRASDQDYPGHPYPDYDSDTRYSDRSDYDNYRSYERRRPRYRDDPRMIVRRSPSGGFIDRTNSMPTIRYDRRAPHGYPHRRPQGYRHPHERRHRSRRHNPEYDQYRDPHRYPDRQGRYPHDARSRYPKDYPPGHIPPQHPPHDRQLPNGGIHAPPTHQQVERVTQNGDVFHAPRGSPQPSSTSSESGERRRDQRVSFKETASDDVEKGQMGEVTEVSPETEKLLMAKKDEEDAVSLGSEASDMSESELRPRRLLIRRSIAIWFAWFCMGFFTEVVGPNIPYLRGRLNGTHDDVAISLGARGAGLAVGSAVGGLLCEVAPNFVDLWISTSLILGALCTSAVPWSMNLIHLCLTLGLSGLSKGFLQVATVTLVFSLWQQRGAMYVIFFIHMAYAIGAAPCAQLALLFDAGVLEHLLLGSNSTSSSYDSPDIAPRSEAIYTEPQEELLGGILDSIPRPMYPFDMAAVLTFVCGAVFLAFFGSSIRSVPRATAAVAKAKAAKAGEGAAAVEPSSRCFIPGSCGGRGALGLFVYFLLPMAVLAVVGSFHHLYLTTISNPFSRSEALLLQTVFWGAIALGCLVAPVTTRCLSPNGLTISCLTMSILSTALLGVYGEKYPVFVWIFTILLGIFSGPLVPAGLTLCSICLSPSAMGVVVAFVFQAVGDGAFSWVAGFLLSHYRPEYLLYTALASSGTAFLLYLPIIPVLARKKTHLKPKKKKIPNGKAIG